jgi:hypothetical protein
MPQLWQTGARRPAITEVLYPEWAEFMVIKITLSGMSAGSLYVDKVKVTNL